MNRNNGTIIPIAWPDDLVASNLMKYDNFLSWFNICKNGFYKVGHAAMLLINEDTGKVCYYDFGRYIAEPRRYGRIRSVKTDAELAFDIKAFVQDGKIVNLEEILLYTNAHPHTHGKGTMYASVRRAYNFESVYRHIEQRQSQGLIKYGAFEIGGTNCSRFVAQTMAAFADPVEKFKILYPWYGTPSPLGNVFKGNGHKMYVVNEGQIKAEDVSRFIKQFNTLREKILFDNEDYTPHIKESRKGAFEPKNRPDFLSPKAQWIGGVGSGAWHEILEIHPRSVRFRRSQQDGHIDIDDYFQFNGLSDGLDPAKEVSFVPGTNCAKLILRQENKEFIYLPAKERRLRLAGIRAKQKNSFTIF